MKSKITEELKEIEKLIQSARGADAQARLLELHKKRVSKDFAREIATLARRAGIPEFGLRLLHPIVRATGKKQRDASVPDRVEYAACLIRLEALREAEEILLGVPENEVPETLLFLAIIQLKKWNYADAIPFLRSYLRQKNLTEYQTILGKLNLGMVLAYENILGEAKSVLGEVLEETSRLKFDLLHGNALRFLGNLEMNRNHWDAAQACFAQSLKALKNVPGVDQYFSKKWNTLAAYLSDPANEASYKDVLALREEAIKIRHWESVRDIDFHIALAKQDEALFRSLYFGTANKKFQEKILNKWRPEEVPEDFLWQLGASKKTREFLPQIDIAQGQPTEKGDFLKVGQTMQKLYVVLLSDFYRPFSILEVFEKLFPGEYYSPGVSEFRVHQTIKRLRQWFEKNDIPLTIENVEKDYRLASTSPCVIRLHHLREVKSSSDHWLELIREKLGEEFSIRDVVPLMKVTRRRAGEVIRQAVEAGVLTASGSKNQVRYRFNQPADYKKAS